MKAVMLSAMAGFVLVATTAPANAAMGGDATVCEAGDEPAVLAEISGLKDRTGRLKLELYPATEGDFLKDDRDLLAQGKVFRRVWADMPKTGPVELCIKVPRPGKYALFFTHDRDGKNKFNIWVDGAGLPTNHRIGMSKPKLTYAIIDVSSGVTVTRIRAQYLRSVLSGFGPLKDS